MNTSSLDLLRQILPLLIPILVIQLVLMAYCLVDLMHREQTKGPKWVWALIIIFGELIGPIVYLIFGRKE